MLYHEYWLQPPSWITETATWLRGRGLPVAPGVHLDQLRPRETEQVLGELLAEPGAAALFVYPPATPRMRDNWETVRRLLRR